MEITGGAERVERELQLALRDLVLRAVVKCLASPPERAQPPRLFAAASTRFGGDRRRAGLRSKPSTCEWGHPLFSF